MERVLFSVLSGKGGGGGTTLPENMQKSRLVIKHKLVIMRATVTDNTYKCPTSEFGVRNSSCKTTLREPLGGYHRTQDTSSSPQERESSGHR